MSNSTTRIPAVQDSVKQGGRGVEKKTSMVTIVAAARKEISEKIKQERAEDKMCRYVLFRIQAALLPLGISVSIVGGRMGAKGKCDIRKTSLGFIPSRFKELPLSVRRNPAGDLIVAGFDKSGLKERHWTAINGEFSYSAIAKYQSSVFHFRLGVNKCRKEQRRLLRRLPESLTRYATPICIGKHSDKSSVGCLLKTLERAWFYALDDN